MSEIAHFVGQVARPFAIIFTSFSASWAAIVTAYKVENGNDGAILLGAIFAGVGALYIGKAWEVAKAGKHEAEVKIAEAGK